MLAAYRLLTPCHSVSVSTLLDLGSSGNFISQALLKHLNLPRRRQAQELRIEAIQGKPRGRIKYRSPPVSLHVGCFHHKTISFLVLEGPTVDLILGCPWLTQHSAEVRWDTSKVTSEACFQNCLSLMSPHLQRGPPDFKSNPPSWKAQNLRKTRKSHLTTWCTRMCSVNRQPPSYHHIGHGTVH